MLQRSRTNSHDGSFRVIEGSKDSEGVAESVHQRGEYANMLRCSDVGQILQKVGIYHLTLNFVDRVLTIALESPLFSSSPSPSISECNENILGSEKPALLPTSVVSSSSSSSSYHSVYRLMPRITSLSSLSNLEMPLSRAKRSMS